MVADLFHYGHINLLKKARECGDYLLVGIHSDEVVESYKRKPILTTEERMITVAACRYVDKAIPDAPLAVTREWIQQNEIDLVVHGDDFTNEMRDICYKVPMEMGIYHEVSYTPGISTTEIIARCKIHPSG